VPSASRLAHTRLGRAGLPDACIVVAIRRRGRTHFPHGETVLEPGDMVVASVGPGQAGAFRDRFRPRGDDGHDGEDGDDPGAGRSAREGRRG